MTGKVFLEDLQTLLNDMKSELQTYGYNLKLTGGLQERGYTGHDVDLDVSMPQSQCPNEEIFLILNWYGNEFQEKHHLTLDLTLSFKGKPRFKLDEGGFFEYQEDGSLELTSV